MPTSPPNLLCSTPTPTRSLTPAPSNHIQLDESVILFSGEPEPQDDDEHDDEEDVWANESTIHNNTTAINIFSVTYPATLPTMRLAMCQATKATTHLR